jgi:uncharacterized protein YecE (DUF72 family)
MVEMPDIDTTISIPEELRPWIQKVKQIQAETQVVRGYFNNHYGAKAVNALEFREMLGEALSSEQQHVVEQAQNYFAQKFSLSPS